MKAKIFAIILISLVNLQAYCNEQFSDTTETNPVLAPFHRNVIKLNPTPMLIFSNIKNITFSYERLIRDNQSISAQAGFIAFKGIFDDTVAGIVNFTGNESQPGLNLAFDYRYYPFSRNRRPAPDGVFIGGYIGGYGFSLNNNFDILHTEIDQDGEIKGNLNVINLGFSLGYQFIFWKRMTVDLLVFGPSLQMIWGNGKISGDLDEGEIDGIDQELVDKLLDKFPLLEEIFSSESLSFTGNRTTFGTGFRYSVQIGFHF